MTANGSSLREYDRLKLELADIVRLFRQYAERTENSRTAAECRTILSCLAEDRFNLVVLGQFSRGKSSLMNAILGTNRLPTGILPLTSVVTTVTYGDRERVLIQHRGWTLPQEISLDQLRGFVTQEGNPGNAKEVIRADVQLPNELLRRGFAFVDTPGIGSAVVENTRTTTQFLPEADAAIFITAVDSPLSEIELQFLREIQQHVRKIFIVVNKRDLLTPEEESNVLAFIRDRLQVLIGPMIPQVHLVSARDGLVAKLERNQERLRQSGIPELEADLAEFLRTGKTRELLWRTGRRAASILDECLTEIRIRDMLATDAAGRLAYEREAIRRVEKLQEEFEAAVSAVRDIVDDAVVSTFEQEICEAIKELRVVLTSAVHKQSLWSWNTLAASDNNREVRTAGDEYLNTWLRQPHDLLHRALQQLLEGPPGRLSERLAGDELLNDVLSAARDTSAVFSRIELPDCDIRTSIVSTALSPIPAIRAYLWRRIELRLDGYLDLCGQSMKLVLVTAGRDWLDRFGAKSREAFQQASRHVHNLLDGPNKSDAVELDRLRDRLRRVDEAVSENRDSEATGLHETDSLPPHSKITAYCEICVRCDNAVYGYMSKIQYELSASEAERTAHAKRGGFCPLHTWQYESVASPQGVCSAYPPLMFATGARLRGLMKHQGSPALALDGLRRTVAGANACLVCKLISSEEKKTAANVLRRLSGQEPTDFPAICMRHLETVLSLEPPAEIRRRLLDEQARVLERIAENMQRYALKHEGLRRHLMSEAEHFACEAGLARLVGLRKLTTAPKIR